MVSPYAVESVGGMAFAWRVCWVGVCIILFGRVACVSVTGVCMIVVSVGVSVWVIGIYIVLLQFVSMLGANVEVWSCALEGLGWWANVAGRIVIFCGMGMSCVGVTRDVVSPIGIGGIVSTCLGLRIGFGCVGWVVACL